MKSNYLWWHVSQYIQWNIVLVINVSVYSEVLISFDNQGGRVYYKTYLSSTIHLHCWTVLVVLFGAVGASPVCLSEPVKVTKAKKAVNGNKKQAVEVEEDDDDDDDEEDDSEEESEEEEAAPVKAKAVKAKKAMEVEEDDEEDSDEDDDEEESDEEDDEEEDDDEEAEMTQKKRKATGADTPAKKAKIETGMCRVTWFTCFGCATCLDLL